MPLDTHGAAQYLPEPSATYWLSSSPLPPGNYFVHVAGYEPSCAYVTCPGRQW